MSRKGLAVAMGVLAIAGAAVAVHAQGRHGWRDGPMMLGGDEGGMGAMHGRFGRALTKDEFDTRARERFARLDKNSDGVIDASEIDAAMASRMSARHGFRGDHGAGPGTMGAAMLHRLGAGADGKLTREQFRAAITRRFAEADLNNDGRIDDADLPPMMRGRNALSQLGQGAGPGHGGHAGVVGWLRMLQVTPKDGAVTRDDVLAAADRRFDAMDRNKDGVVDQTDFDALRKDTADYAVKRFLHSYGADKDGRVTRDQFMAKAAERFARLDVNGDGTVSRDEMPRGGHGRGGWMHGRQADRGGPAGGPMGDGEHPMMRQGMGMHAAPPAAEPTAPPAKQ